MAGKKPAASSSSSSSKGGGASKSTKPAPLRATTSSKNEKSSSQQQPTSQTTERNESAEELKRQQVLLDIFRSAFRDVLEAEDFGSRLQEVKTALFNRDFEGAFSHEAALDVYAARWSPTRALCYGRVLRELGRYLEGLLVSHGSPTRTGRAPHGLEKDIVIRKEKKNNAEGDGDGAGDSIDRIGQDLNAAEGGGAGNPGPGEEEEAAPKTTTTTTTAAQEPNDEGSRKGEGEGEGEGEERKRPLLRVLAIGGAAAEIAAFADYLASSSAAAAAEITLLDVGPWGSVVQRLQTSLTSPPSISRYASAAAQEEARRRGPLVGAENYRTTFLQRDILSLSSDELAGLVSRRRRRRHHRGDDEDEDDGADGPVLITLLFTLNELYTAGGIKRTTSLLRSLSALVCPGTLLLVVDSPGSYSEAAVGKEARRYPMQWLLDHTLVPPHPPPSRRKQKQKSTGDDDGDSVGVETGVEGSIGSSSVEGEGEGEREGGGVRWERLESHDSVWLRVAEGLRYPIPLENMRYQMHLYRASAA